MIFGKEWSEKSCVGNVIMGNYAFENEIPSDECVVAEGLVKDKHLTVILTPNVISKRLTEEHLHQRVKQFISLCGQGPRAYVLVAHPQDFSESDLSRVMKIFTSVLDQALECTLVVKFLPEDEDKDEHVVGSSVDENVTDALCELIKDCGGKCYRFNRNFDEDCTQIEILEKIENIMVRDKNLFEDALEALEQQSQKPNPEILCK